MVDGFQVDLGALEQASEGIQDSIGALRDEISFASKAGANQGWGVDELALSEDDLGSGDLNSALDEFCDKWEWGVKFLVEEGKVIADALTDTRSAYEKMEDGVSDTLKKIVNGAFGDPSKSSADATAMSWGEIGGDVMPGSDMFGNGMEGAPQEMSDSFGRMGDAWGQGAQQWQPAVDAAGDHVRQVGEGGRQVLDHADEAIQAGGLRA